MAEKAPVSLQSSPRFPSYFRYFAVAWFAFWILIVATGGMDSFLLVGILAIFPILVISIALIVRLIVLAARKDHRQVPPILAWLGILAGIPMLLYFYERQHPLALRESVKWLASSGKYKAEVQAEKDSANGKLKHIEWDFSGPSFATTTVYLAFDPSDSLAAAAKSHQPGKFVGLPCRVYEVRRLESHWYAIAFYIGDDWNHCT
jgi:hypothetical protein